MQLSVVTAALKASSGSFSKADVYKTRLSLGLISILVFDANDAGCNAAGERMQPVCKVKPWLGTCHLILVTGQFECKPECQPVNLPRGHPLTFPLVSCLMGLKLHRQLHETLSIWHFTEHDCCCVAPLLLRSQLPQIIACLQIHKPPAPEITGVKMGHKSLIVNF